MKQIWVDDMEKENVVDFLNDDSFEDRFIMFENRMNTLEDTTSNIYDTLAELIQVLKDRGVIN